MSGDDVASVLFEGWSLTEADRCAVPTDFAFDEPEKALHWDEGPIVLFAKSASNLWVCTRADEDAAGAARWCCAAIERDEADLIASRPGALRQRELWERRPVLVVEAWVTGSAPVAAWQVPVGRLNGLRPVFLDEDAPLAASD